MRYKRRTKMKKLKRVLLVLITMMAIAVPVSGYSQTVAVNITEPSNIMCQVTGSSDSINLTWWMPYNANSAYVEYGSSPDLSKSSTVRAEQVYSSENRDYRVYEAQILGLLPDTDYYYRVSGGDVQRFHSAGSSENFSFVFMGDAQYSRYFKEYDEWQKLLERSYEKNPETAFYIMGGDMINNGQDSLDWNEFLSRASSVFGKAPVAFAAGNHECNDNSQARPLLMKKLFAMPQNGPQGFEEEFYSFEYKDCHIQVVSSDIFEAYRKGKIKEENLQAISEWIKNDLNISKCKWKIVVTHHPVYTVVSDRISDAVKSNWEEIFADAKVDLVLCGHQQVYMRTKELKGITYVMGVSGGKLYPAKSLDYIASTTEYVPNYQKIEIKNNHIKVTSLDVNDNILDIFTISQRGKILLSDFKAVAGKNRTVRVSWIYNSRADGYQIKVSTDKKFAKNTKTYKTCKNYKIFKSLKKNKIYYIKARGFKTENKKTVYGSWTTVKKIKK